MSTSVVERLLALLVGLLAIGAAAWMAAGADFLWFPFDLAAAALASAAGLLVWVAGDSSGRLSGWLWGLGSAAVLALGSAADYQLWFTDSRAWTVGCHALALLFVALSGLRGGWVGGLRAALVGVLVATALLLALVRDNLGVPEQTAVFQAAGILDAYEAMGGTNFQRWVTEVTLNAVLLRTLAAVLAGLILGSATHALVRVRKA